MPRTPDPDDAALRWDDVDDPSHVESGAAAADEVRGAASTEGAAAESRTDGDLTAAARPGRALAVRGLTALFAVIYLAYSVGWILGIGFVPLTGPTLLIEVMYQFSEFLAIVASALWFGSVIALTRGAQSVVRLGWLALGTLVLIPWPLLLGVAL